MNILAVLVAALTSFLLGGLWYSKLLFGPAWGRAAGRVAEPGAKHRHPARVFGISYALAVVAAACLSAWLGPHPGMGVAVSRGLLAGAGFVATSFGINYQFSERSTMLWAIDGGYHVAQFVLFGVVLGAWPGA